MINKQDNLTNGDEHPEEWRKEVVSPDREKIHEITSLLSRRVVGEASKRNFSGTTVTQYVEEADKQLLALLPAPLERPDREKMLRKILHNSDNYQKIEYPIGSAPWAEDPVELNTEKVIPQIIALLPAPLVSRELRKKIDEIILEMQNDADFQDAGWILRNEYRNQILELFPDEQRHEVEFIEHPEEWQKEVVSPDREKMLREIAAIICGAVIDRSPNQYEIADQILALIPDIEEAERERIIKQLQGVYNQAGDLRTMERQLRDFLEGEK